MKKIICVILALAMLMLSGCGCKHEWNEATCQNPKTCALCGQTEGQAPGHAWAEATTEAPKTCTVCGATEGEPLEEVIDPALNTITYKQAYTFEQTVVAEEKDTVVATLGEKELTNGELQLYYQDAISSFLAEAYYYLSYFGLDPAQPLSAQPCSMAEDLTWEQYFLESALENWQAYTLLEILAEEQGYALDADIVAALESDAQSLETRALQEGYANADEYIHHELSVNVDAADYHHFNWVYYLSNYFLNDYYASVHPDQETIDAYFVANEEALAAKGVVKDLGLISDVRHILIAVEGGTMAEDGTVTYSEAEWATAKAEAEQILQEWKDGEATEDSFAALASTHTDDTASIPSGGLYTGLSYDQPYMESFLNWAIDPVRQVGDTDIVQTPYGYHIMYFVQGEDYCNFLVAEEIIAEQVREMLHTAQENYPVAISFNKIYLGEPQLGI